MERKRLWMAYLCYNAEQFLLRLSFPFDSFQLLYEQSCKFIRLLWHHLKPFKVRFNNCILYKHFLIISQFIIIMIKKWWLHTYLLEIKYEIELLNYLFFIFSSFTTISLHLLRWTGPNWKLFFYDCPTISLFASSRIILYRSLLISRYTNISKMRNISHLLFRNSLSAGDKRLMDAMIAILHGISANLQLGLPLLMATGFDGEKQHRPVPAEQFHYLRSTFQ